MYEYFWKNIFFENEYKDKVSIEIYSYYLSEAAVQLDPWDSIWSMRISASKWLF